MADGYVNLQPLYNALGRIENNLTAVNANFNSRISAVDAELDALKQDFLKMMIENRNNAALQRAMTEIIRIRQEIEQKFGSHQKVRDYMLGILQASDLKLIMESTISKCTEELMLSAPNYWLAPCLIALSAWISNNEALAKRAVKVAIKRDEEKTCLLFALVCRRNGRSDACFAWLGRYFSLQDKNVKKMKSSVIAFVSAYVNGAFGEDKDHVCREHLDHWMDLLKADNPNFAQDQTTRWKSAFENLCLSNTSADYMALKELSPQFPLIDAYVTRIHAVQRNGGVKDFLKDVVNAEADNEKLVNEIDRQLTLLVTEFEEGEEQSLRYEERLMQEIKKRKGDEEHAVRFMNAMENMRKDVPVDFAARLNQAAWDTSTDIAARKAAFELMRQYIEEGFHAFISEHKDEYPEEITLNVNENGYNGGSGFKWSGKTKNAENRAQLEKEVSDLYDKDKNDALAKVKVSKAAWAFCWLFYIPVLVSKNRVKKAKEEINSKYANMSKDMVDKLDKALNARVRMNKMVSDYQSKKDYDGIKLDSLKVEEPAATKTVAEETATQL